MATEDLLQPGHVVKERWKVVRSFFFLNFLFTIFQLTFDGKKDTTVVLIISNATFGWFKLQVLEAFREQESPN